jgi:hypothetical protein
MEKIGGGWGFATELRFTRQDFACAIGCHRAGTYLFENRDF